MIDHTQMSVHADNHKATVAFYEEVLKSIGYEKLLAFGPNEEYVGFGDRAMPHHQMHTDWWIVSRPEKQPKSHHAFRCKDRAAVDAFYTAAVAAGGEDNDPAGNNIEAVCHDPQ